MVQIKADRTTEMATFLAVVCAGSLSAAARELDLTPSAVSRIVTRIEERLGVRLVLRTTRSLRLTAEGESYARVARRVLADLDEMESTIADRGSPRGQIRVSAATAHARLVITPLLAGFVARYPDITVELEASDEVADVLEGSTDVGIRFGPLGDSPLTARRLGETGRTVVASPAYLEQAGTPRTPADLARHNCLDFSFRRIEPGWPFREDGRDYLLPVNGNIRANNGETLVQLAMEGVGITRVGNFHIGDALASGALVPLLEAYNPRDRESINAVFLGGASMPARVRVFVDYLVEALARDRNGAATSAP
ncbi:MAG: LysR family transcriptional regulator [Stappia sp.]|uniref:LysR family transcriptional regulator n=1 Tax=Stappia sp. TaxID=1870903 RepID=UPI000C6503F6|nr:LysR family transcriptional regulator [Stappia sp.]MAA96759.1 LysR family transcriptional regulator [Stappia sp.]MBM21878.1 LysR family transcriptional regulator [Stappia sp.]